MFGSRALSTTACMRLQRRYTVQFIKIDDVEGHARYINLDQVTDIKTSRSRLEIYFAGAVTADVVVSDLATCRALEHYLDNKSVDVGAAYRLHLRDAMPSTKE
jgi:hypothetical protein